MREERRGKCVAPIGRVEACGKKREKELELRVDWAENKVRWDAHQTVRLSGGT